MEYKQDNDTFDHWDDDDDDDSEDAGGVEKAGPAADAAPRMNTGASGEICEARRLNKVKRKSIPSSTVTVTGDSVHAWACWARGRGPRGLGSCVRLGPHTCDSSLTVRSVSRASGVWE